MLKRERRNAGEGARPSGDAEVMLLAGRRVLDLSRGPSGMFCGKLLHWIGAEVTLVVPPGDPAAASWEPLVTVDGGTPVSLRHLHYNHGKARVEVDLRSQEGRQWLCEAAGQSDIIVEDWGGEDAFGRETGVRLADLRQRNPGLVICRVSPFGQRGPYAPVPASELSVLASSGLLYLTGDPANSPLRVGEDLGWNLAGLHAAAGALLALLKALRSGCGEEVDVSAQASIAVTLEAPYGRVMAAAPVTRMGSRHYATSPCNIYRARDGWIGVCANQDVQIAGIVDAVSRGRYIDPIPVVDDLRRKQSVSLWFDEVLANLIKERLVAELVDESRRRGLLMAKVNDVADLADDPHIIARNVIGPLGAGYPAAWRDVTNPIRVRGGAGRSHTPRSPISQDARPLEGLTVVDFTWAWAGPYCTKILGAAGAEIIKVENPNKPDVLRRYPPSVGSNAENECSSFFADQNWNKKSVLLDMKKPESLELVRSLLRDADVVVENFRPPVMASWGLSFDEVHLLNPRMIYASISGYGATGPYRSRPAYGALMESEGGLASLIRYADGRPYRTGTSMPDPVLGALGAVAVAAGLARSLETGQGMHIDLAMIEASLAMLGPAVLAWSATGQARRLDGNLSWEGAPEGCYRCDGPDEWVALSVTGLREWRALGQLIDAPELLRDPRLDTAEGRVSRRYELDERIERWSLKRKKGEAAAELQRAGVPAFAVLTLAELLEDPQLDEFGFLPTVNHREMGTVKLLGIPFRMSGRSWSITQPPPLLGEHTAEVVARARTNSRS
jgi:crotonobetainyl-CoA:carnitine CoA-transferase CaiB-like acyl-CoA transferase